MFIQKKNRAVALLIAIIPIILGSCSKKTEEPKAQEVKKTQSQGALRSEDIATIISNGDFSISEFESLASSIKENAEIGYDEKIFLSDLSSLRASENSFASKLLKMLNTSSLRSFSSNDFSLYWRSCEMWNKKEKPVIAYVSKDTPDSAKTIPAFEIDENGKVLKTIMIDEEYTKKHPSIIVNNDEKPSGKLIPIRPEGYVSSLKPFNHTFPLPDLKIRKVKSLYLGDLQVTKQFDCWFRGGSEISFTIAYPRVIIGENGQVSFQRRLTEQFRNVTRDQIDNKEVLHLDYDLVLDWDSKMDCIGFFAYEDDAVLPPGGSIEFKFSYKGVECSVKATIPNSRQDIVKVDYTGDYLMSTDNIIPDTKQWRIHHANGINYTLPVKIAEVLPDYIFEDSIAHHTIIYNP